MSLRKQRVELIQQIADKDQARYGYIIYEPFTTQIGSNYLVYPNEFFSCLLENIKEFTEYHDEVMKDHQHFGSKYLQFMNQYAACYQVLYQQQLQQQQQLYLQQQQQIQQQQQSNYQNQGFSSQTGNHQYQQSQNANQYTNQTGTQYGGQIGQYGNQAGQHNGYQKQHYNNYNNQQLQGAQTTAGQTGHTPYTGQQSYQQNGYNNQRNYQNKNYQQGGNIQQQGTYQQSNQTGEQGQTQYQQYRYQNNQQNRGSRQYQNYNQGQAYQGQRYNNQGQQGENTQHYTKYNNRQNYNNYQAQNVQGQQYQAQTQAVEQQVPKVEQIVAPVEPVKQQPKMMKFSLKQIRQFIGQWNDKQKENVNQVLIDKVNEVNGWTKGETSFEERPEKTQDHRKYDNNRNKQREQQKDGPNSEFNRGKNYKPNSEPPAQLVRKNTNKLQIVTGKNQTLEARMIKQQIKNKAGQDFDTLMRKQNQSLDTVQMAKKQIIYNLNLLAPQNIKDIQKDLEKYLFEQKEVCQILITQIIEKAWGQPKYASTYAKLCSQFSRFPGSRFNFETNKEKKQKKQNPFKLSLISTVQHSFDKKVEETPVFNNEEEKEKHLTDTKKKILGNVKFIAELIRSKLLKKKIMKICISQLIFTFLAKYYYFRKTDKLIDSYFDYYFEALIEFIQNVGQFYEKMDQSTKEKEDAITPYEPAENRVIELIEMNQKPPEEQIQEIVNLKADDYFKLFQLIDQKVLRKTNTRLSALLLNLTERRTNNWQKHHAETDGPKKLKDIKQDIARQEQEMNKVKIQKKANMEHLHDLVKAMYKDWDSDSKNQKTHFKAILKEYKEVEFLTACLNQLPDDKKEPVRKRVDLFDIIIDTYFNLKTWRDAWFDCIKFMAFNAGDFPFSGAAIALVLKRILSKQNTSLKDFYMKSEDEDEQFFINEVFGKLYIFTKWQQIKQFTEPNKKYGNMFDN